MCQNGSRIAGCMAKYFAHFKRFDETIAVSALTCWSGASSVAGPSEGHTLMRLFICCQAGRDRMRFSAIRSTCQVRWCMATSLLSTEANIIISLLVLRR